MRPDKKPRSAPVHNPARALKQCRKYAKNIALTVLFGKLVLSFCLGGAGEEGAGGGTGGNPACEGAGGWFDPLSSRNRLQQARISEAQYVTEMRREIAANQLFGVVRPEGLAPKSLRDDIFKMESEKRVAETLYIPDPIATDEPKPPAEHLHSYIDGNQTTSQTPEFLAF